MKAILVSILALVVLFTHCARAQSFLDRLHLRQPPTNTPPALAPGLSREDMTGGLKEALVKGVETAAGALGREGGFLNDASVKIPMPDSLQKVERTLRALRQDKLADDFITTMNRAAEQAVPEAVSVLGESIKQLSITDAKAILAGTNTAATQYFRRTSETNLCERFLPIVHKATEQAGVTSAYKKMAGRVSGGFGGFGGNLVGAEMPDLDSYVTHKALDGLFLKIAEQEKRIRENPVLRTTDLLRKVFGAAGK